MVHTRFVPITAVFLTALVCSMRAQPGFSDWSEPENLGPVVNSTGNDAGPALSKDRLSLYFSSNRSGAGGSDLFVSQRSSVTAPWGTPVNLGPVVNSAVDDATPNLSRDGHWLFFMSRRPGSLANAMGVVGFDIWVSHRQHVHDDFDWEPPAHLGPPVNSGSFDQSPFFFDNDDVGLPQIYFTRTLAATGNDILVTHLQADGTFSEPTQVSELNSTVSDAGASVRFDGLELFFSRRTGGLGNSDLWTATRNHPLDPWSPPFNLGAVVNSGALDFDPHIDSSREALYFTSDRTGGSGGQDLYVTTRAKQNRSIITPRL